MLHWFQQTYATLSRLGYLVVLVLLVMHQRQTPGQLYEEVPMPVWLFIQFVIVESLLRNFTGLPTMYEADEDFLERTNGKDRNPFPELNSVLAPPRPSVATTGQNEQSAANTR